MLFHATDTRIGWLIHWYKWGVFSVSLNLKGIWLFRGMVSLNHWPISCIFSLPLSALLFITRFIGHPLMFFLWCLSEFPLSDYHFSFDSPQSSLHFATPTCFTSSLITTIFHHQPHNLLLWFYGLVTFAIHLLPNASQVTIIRLLWFLLLTFPVLNIQISSFTYPGSYLSFSPPPLIIYFSPSLHLYYLPLSSPHSFSYPCFVFLASPEQLKLFSPRFIIIIFCYSNSKALFQFLVH